VDDRAAKDGISNEAAKKRCWPISSRRASSSRRKNWALAVFLCSTRRQVRGVAWNMDGGWVAQ
jgi:3-hydroxybutyrate dehydrogenase